MCIKMFDLFYADLSKNTTGCEQGGIRPVVVIQNNTGNLYSPGLIVLPVTSEIKKIHLPTHCIIHKSNTNGLNVDSMVMAEQIRTIDKSRLIKKIGQVDNISDQNNIINVYIANITGKKTYNSLWARIINMFVNLILEGGVSNVN